MNGGKIVDNFVINGGHELFGEVSISGAKNAATLQPSILPITSGVCTLTRVLKHLSAEALPASEDSSSASVGADNKSVRYRPRTSGKP